MKAISSLAENVQQQVDLTGRFFLDRHQKKNAPTGRVGAALKTWFLLVVENPETTALHVRKNIAAAKSKGCICGKNAVRDEARAVIGGIDRKFGKDHAAPRITGIANGKIRVNMIGRIEERVIRSDRKSDDLYCPNESSSDTAVEPANESSGVGGLSAVPEGGLLHGPADFAPP